MFVEHFKPIELRDPDFLNSDLNQKSLAEEPEELDDCVLPLLHSLRRSPFYQHKV